MTGPSDLDEHALYVGAIFGNLLSLDLAVRVAIGKLDTSNPLKVKFAALAQGSWVDVDPFTDPRSIEPMLERFNALVPAADALDVGQLVRLRDALAHGRIMGTVAKPPLKLFKFSRYPRADGKVEVETVFEMTTDWLKQQRAFVYSALQTVGKYCV